MGARGRTRAPERGRRRHRAGAGHGARRRRLVDAGRAGAGRRGRLRLPRRRRRDPQARPAVAVAARGRARPVAHLRPRRLRLDRPGLDGSPAGRLGRLRAAPRHLHPRGHPRRRDRPAPAPGRARRRPGRAAAGQRRQRHPQLGLRRRAAGTPCTSRTAAPRRTSASSTPATPPVSASCQDVVYNHLGPSGNYLPVFGPYLHATGQNSWGSSLNLDGEGSTEVRRYVLDNVRRWLEDFHVDALRLDAVHALADSSITHLLEEMAIEVAALSAHLRRPLTLIAESDLNDTRMVTPREAGGRGPGRPVERRLPPRGARGADRGDERVLRRLRAARGAGEGLRARVLPRRHVLLLPRSRPRAARRHRRDAHLAAGGRQPEPRPDRQPGHRRPPRGHARRRPARRARRC